MGEELCLTAAARIGHGDQSGNGSYGPSYSFYFLLHHTPLLSILTHPPVSRPYTPHPSPFSPSHSGAQNSILSRHCHHRRPVAPRLARSLDSVPYSHPSSSRAASPRRKTLRSRLKYPLGTAYHLATSPLRARYHAARSADTAARSGCQLGSILYDGYRRRPTSQQKFSNSIASNTRGVLGPGLTALYNGVPYLSTAVGLAGYANHVQGRIHDAAERAGGWGAVNLGDRLYERWYPVPGAASSLPSQRYRSSFGSRQNGSTADFDRPLSPPPAYSDRDPYPSRLYGD